VGYVAAALAGIVAALAQIAVLWAAAWYFSPVQIAAREVEKLGGAAK
jgi:hypothetical protein